MNAPVCHTPTIGSLAAFVAHALRAARLVVTDRRVPLPLRGLVLIGALPIPGPLDEFVLFLTAGALFTLYREPMREAWERSGD